MKKFLVTVVKTVVYKVEVDETIWNAKEQESWEKVFWKLPDTFESDDPDIEAAAGFAESLAVSSCDLGVNEFIEGFGTCAQSEKCAKMFGEEKFTKGLYIKEIDTDYDCETKKIKDDVQEV
jgi:hypothetical protein